MPVIFELLGYPATDDSREVAESRKKAYCPFISDTCDGGGNRHMSDIDLKRHPELQKMFPGMDTVPSGVCSIQLAPGTAPWIICPRRLLYMGQKADWHTLFGETQRKLLEKCNFVPCSTIGIWSELKVTYSEGNNDSFDYTFDYVLVPLGRVSSAQAELETGMRWQQLMRILENNGHSFAMREGQIYVEDFPVGKPVIVEVMTSSTSGGNKNNRSCIPQAFEDCVLKRQHLAPGINYRQVWARMASQLIVKSQAAMAWGGKTIWVLQDLLANYISSSTALDLSRFVAEHTNEVNILTFSYGENYRHPIQTKTVSLGNSVLYSGPIRPNFGKDARPCFQDIVLASVCPPRRVLMAALCRKEMANVLTTPDKNGCVQSRLDIRRR